MDSPSNTSVIALRWVTVFAIVFAIAAAFEIAKQIQSATYNREVHPESITAPLGGPNVVEYEFSAEHRTLKGLWVFFYVPPNAATEVRLTLAVRRAGDEHPLWSQSFECIQSQLVAQAYLCRVEGLTLKKQERYVLTYAMPEMKTGGGWCLYYDTLGNSSSTITSASQVQHSAEPSMLWLEEQPRFPRRNMLACALLLAICSLAARHNTSFKVPALLTLLLGCILLATYHWQLNLWQFWGNFWPDEYPLLSYKLYSFFTGRISFKECLAFFDNHRNGQAFFVPAMMAAFQVVGLSIKGSYLATNGVFLAGAAALLLGLLRIHRVTSDRAVIAAGLLLFSHRCFIGAVGELQTDLGGVVATMLFVYALPRAFATEDASVRLGWYIACGVVGFLGCTVRTALLSLPLVPACLFVWSLFCERQRPRQERLSYLIPSFTGVTLLWVCWWSLGLWGTLHLAWADGRRAPAAFPWEAFAINTLLGMQFSLAIIFVLWRRLFDDRGFAVVVGSAFSLLALLACAPEVPWFRYWDSAAVLGAILFIWILKEWPARDRALLGVAWTSALLNLLIK